MTADPGSISAGGDRTLREGQAVHAAGSRLRLLVIGDGVLTTVPLPDAGELVVGRADDADVRIDDPLVSRRHVALRLGPPLSVVDLGSANGTRVRERALAPGGAVQVEYGEFIDLGTTMIAVQQHAEPARLRRLWTHGYFEGRLEDECLRAEGSGAAFALLRVRCGGVSPGVVQEALAALVGPADVVGSYGPGEYEVLLVDADAAAAARVGADLVARIGAAGAGVRVGVAGFPHDGRTPEALVARAGAPLRDGIAARPAGGVREVVVADGAMQQLHRLVQRIAAGSISVLLLGETGVGKEVMAEAVHRYSPRREKPFLGLSCAALSETLLESELFGYEKGAFTGAQQVKPGLLETADGGTVFLDEVGELPASLQVKLLRVLEERKVLRVGGLKPRPIDVRFVAATNRDLEAEVARGGFRQDLYYRLNGIALVIPPLRERVGEILPLARTFVAQACRDAGRRDALPIGADAAALLAQYGWPGNIRELRNVMERAVLLAGDGAIALAHLPVEKMGATFAPRSHTRPPVVHPVPVAAPAPLPAPGAASPIRRELADIERQRILEALAACAGNQTRAARMLGISRRTLVNRLDIYDVIRPRKGRPPGEP